MENMDILMEGELTVTISLKEYRELIQTAVLRQTEKAEHERKMAELADELDATKRKLEEESGYRASSSLWFKENVKNENRVKELEAELKKLKEGEADAVENSSEE